MATPLLLVDGADRQLAIRGFLQRRLGGHRADHIVERELLDLAPIEFDQPGGEWLRVLLDLRFNRPVFARNERSEEHTSELQSLMRISYAVFRMKKTQPEHHYRHTTTQTI